MSLLDVRKDKDENGVKFTDEQLDEISKNNNHRLSWGIVAFLRNRYKQRYTRTNGEERYCELRELDEFPGFKNCDRPSFTFQFNDNNFKIRIDPGTFWE